MNATSTLKNNAFALASAIGAEGHCQPASRIVRDGSHKGTMFSWDGREWHVVDLENREYLGHYRCLAVVTLEDGGDAEAGLNQMSLGCDLDCQNGEWVVDADDIDSLKETYGEELTVVWLQS